MRLLLATLVLLVGGCATAYPIQPVRIATMGAAPTTCYVHRGTESEIVDARIVDIRGAWAVTGVVRGARSRAAGQRRVKVEAVSGDEWVVLSTLSPTRNGSRERWMFYLPIPDPGSFDHLHLAVVSAHEAFADLPPHHVTPR